MNATDDQTKERSIGTVTMFHNSINYGGVLQTYALQHVLQNCGYKSTIIRYKTSWNFPCALRKELREVKKSDHVIHSIFVFIRRNAKLCFDFISTKILQKLYLSNKLGLRRYAFNKFNTEHIVATPKVYTEKTITLTSGMFDCFIVGSDQVWNPFLFTPGYGLGFVPEDKQKIAYAASIAQPNLTESDILVMKPYLEQFNAISVRENTACSLLKETMGLQSEWVLDPTLLLSAEEWSSLCMNQSVQSITDNNILTRNSIMEREYIFCYILGAEKEKVEYATKIAENIQMPLVTLPFVSRYFRFHHLKYMQFGEVQLYNAGPTDFLELIKSAAYVITDSFHGAVFSILFHKKFIVLERNSKSAEFEMNSRLQSLLELFDLGAVLISDYAVVPTISCFKDIPYGCVDEILDQERKKSMNYLRKSLSNNIQYIPLDKMRNT